MNGWDSWVWILPMVTEGLWFVSLVMIAAVILPFVVETWENNPKLIKKADYTKKEDPAKLQHDYNISLLNEWQAKFDERFVFPTRVKSPLSKPFQEVDPRWRKYLQPGEVKLVESYSERNQTHLVHFYDAQNRLVRVAAFDRREMMHNLYYGYPYIKEVKE